LIADDHPLFRTALRHAAGHFWPEAQIVEANSAERARKALSAAPIAALLLDLHMADSNGLSVLMDLMAF
jgi:DNA-binding NarL/FixJ family response regulator